MGGTPKTKQSRSAASGGGSKASSARSPVSPRGGGHAMSPSPTGAKSGPKVKELETRCTELQLVIDGLEKERDFYFSKLRDIEVITNHATLEPPISFLWADRSGDCGRGLLGPHTPNQRLVARVECSH